MSTQPTPEWHNPDGLTDEQVGVKDGWRLCLKTETEHEGCEWFSPGRNRWASNYLYEGCVLDPGYTYRTRRPPPDSSTEPKEGGEICPTHVSPTAGQPPEHPVPSVPAELTVGSNAAAGTSNPFQQAAPSRQESAGGNGQAWVLFGREDELELYEYARVPVGDRAALLHAVKAAVWDMPENANEEEAQHITDRLIAEGIYRFEGDPALELETVPPYSMPTAPTAAETDQAPPPESSDDEVLEHVHLDFTTQPVTVARTRPTAPAVAEQELLPCPFCGTEPIHVRTTDECKCRTSLCPASYMLVSRERWNRRPAAPVAVGETPLDCEQKGAEA